MALPWKGVVGWAAGGALLAGGAKGIYNKLEGNQGGAGNFGLYGAMAGAAFAMGKGGGARAKAFLGGGKRMIGKIPGSYKSAATNMVNSWASRAGIGAGKFAGKSENAWVKKLSQRSIRAGVSGAVPGAIYGGLAGAGYGAFSDRDSMISGAMKGALAGAAISSVYRLNKSYKFAKIPGMGLNKTTTSF